MIDKTGGEFGRYKVILTCRRCEEPLTEETSHDGFCSACYRIEEGYK